MIMIITGISKGSQNLNRLPKDKRLLIFFLLLGLDLTDLNDIRLIFKIMVIVMITLKGAI